MPEITRRQLLAFLGATAAVQAAPALLRRTLPGTGASLAEAAWTGAFTPVRVPHPLPIYQSRSSFLAGLGVGQILLPSADPSLATYTVIDDIVVSPELQAYVIVRWGDRVFPDLDDYVGYNHDYTAFFPIHGKSAVQALLWVNHEYVSFPFLRSSPGAPANLSGSPTTFAAVLGFGIPDDPTNLLTLGEMLYNCGGSILRLRRNNRGRYEVEAGDPMNRRIHGLSGLAINAERTDGYQAITAWGALPHQQGDRDYLVGTGPAATEVFPLSSDGLGNRIIGTAFNCSGASTPWDTVLSAEENFQGSSLFFVGVSEDVLPDGTQLGYLPGTTGQRFGQVGEKYGWLVEIDPFGAEPPKKHTALGRFRHENAAIRAERGRPLVVYMGDDRRGGHTWKFVSRDTVGKPSDKHNSRLLEDGTLFVARYGPEGTGVWIPFELSTATGPIPPTVLSSVEFAALGSARRDGLLKLPRRPGVAGQTASGGAFNLTRLNEATALPAYQGKTLGAFYPTKGAALVDAFLAANLIGGAVRTAGGLRDQPARSAPGDHVDDGRRAGQRRLSGLAHLRRREVLRQRERGPAVGLAAQDRRGQLRRQRHHLSLGAPGAGRRGRRAGRGLREHRQPGVRRPRRPLGGQRHDDGAAQRARQRARSDPDDDQPHQTGNTSNLIGVFGNNMLFCVPLTGPNAGQICPVAIGPVRCEMTGPTFVDDTLIISVQHPGEDTPIGTGVADSREIEMLRLDGSLFTQTRTVPRGSNWPSNVEGLLNGPPRPATIGITKNKK